MACLGRRCFSMPSAWEMRRRVAKDSVSQVRLFDLTTQLFLQHVVGVHYYAPYSDDVVSSGTLGVLGCPAAYFAPIQSQCTGGLHFHMHFWALSPMGGSVLV